MSPCKQASACYRAYVLLRARPELTLQPICRPVAMTSTLPAAEPMTGPPAIKSSQVVWPNHRPHGEQQPRRRTPRSRPCLGSQFIYGSPSRTYGHKILIESVTISTLLSSFECVCRYLVTQTDAGHRGNRRRLAGSTCSAALPAATQARDLLHVFLVT